MTNQNIVFLVAGTFVCPASLRILVDQVWLLLPAFVGATCSDCLHAASAALDRMLRASGPATPVRRPARRFTPMISLRPIAPARGRPCPRRLPR